MLRAGRYAVAARVDPAGSARPATRGKSVDPEVDAGRNRRPGKPSPSYPYARGPAPARHLPGTAAHTGPPQHAGRLGTAGRRQFTNPGAVVPATTEDEFQCLAPATAPDGSPAPPARRRTRAERRAGSGLRQRSGVQRDVPSIARGKPPGIPECTEQ